MKTWTPAGPKIFSESRALRIKRVSIKWGLIILDGHPCGMLLCPFNTGNTHKEAQVLRRNPPGN